MTLGEDPIIDEEEEEMVERVDMQLGGMNLDDLVEGQQHQAERQKDGEYGNMVKFTKKTLKGNSTQTTKYKHLKGCSPSLLYSRDFVVFLLLDTFRIQ